ncbi:phytanoyl-CoA dioxygenase family protein [Gammaproteobacteria bacterium]|nr:phytanoyl-CoA dioxygenase family protein [Gammaproteobacteria bacterium]
MKKFINYFYAFVELILAFSLSQKIIWRLVNYKAIKEYQDTKKELSNDQLKILEDIKKDGFAVTNLDFFNLKSLEEIKLFHKTLDPVDSDIKSFLTYYLGGDYKNEIQHFERSNPLLEFSLNEKLVSIINSYFLMLSRLCYLEINETILSSSNAPLKSQNFHRDPGIDKCIKVFIYLNDVETNSGPFTYVKESHLKGQNLFKAKRYGAGGIYPEKNSFKTVIDKNLITPICGKAGTVIIADTTGFHSGGNSIDKIRKMASIVYYPPGDLKKSKINCNIPNIRSSFPASSYLFPN